MTSFARLLNSTVRRTVPRSVRDSVNRWFPGLKERLPPVPFMQAEEIRCIESYLRRHFTMLEFGCGGSWRCSEADRQSHRYYQGICHAGR